MSLNLTAEQPAETPAPEGEVFATLISTDGRPIRLANGPNGEHVLRVGENKPLTFDPFLAAALALAIGSRK